MKRIALALVCCSLSASAALAKEEAPLPKDLPPYGQDKPLPVPEIAQRTLPNGLSVWIVPRTGLPKINVVMAVRGGLSADAPERSGTASLVAGLLNEVPGWIEKVTSADVQRVAKTYFTPANRSVIDRKLAPAATAPAAK